jgi:peptide/nickel transport system substrate-binding protein
MRRFTLAVATAALMMFTLAACGGDDGGGGGGGGSADGETGGTLTLAPLVPAQPWDLKDAGLGNNVTYYQPVYDPLLRLDEKGEPTPNVATEWKYDKSLTELTLTIREGLKFTDGTPVDAEAVKVNLLNTQKGANEAAGMVKVVENVRVVNPTPRSSPTWATSPACWRARRRSRTAR